MTGLDTSLTPLRFLERTAEAFPTKVGIVDGPRRLTWADVAERTMALATALRASGLAEGERVMYLASNSAEHVIAHFAVPLAGGVLVSTNTRLSEMEVAYIIEHSGSRVCFAEPEIASSHHGVLDSSGAQIVVLPTADGTCVESDLGMAYDAFVSRGAGVQPLPWTVEDETATIAINYTSGTTGEPKGVMYTHRGAFLNALNQCQHQGFDVRTKYLWTLPLFHCNGWCTAWAVTAAGGTHVCLRAVRGPDLWELIDSEDVTHLAGAPATLSIMGGADEAHKLATPITVVTAGAPPNPVVLEAFHDLGAKVIHVYGLTETYGPYTICEWQDGWQELSPVDLAGELSRQGIGMVASDRVRVVRTDGKYDDLTDVPADGETLGEIVMTGNTVMKGYFRDQEGTDRAFAGGWFHSGDLGVRYPDGYIKLTDRSKDVVISGGENISSIEVEQSLQRHPAVSDAAVIGVPDERWGEVCKAFVVLNQDRQAEPDELINHVKKELAKYKAPKSIEFLAELPRTATGKVRKHELRQAAPAQTGGNS